MTSSPSARASTSSPKAWRALIVLIPDAVASVLIQLVVGWATAPHLRCLIARKAENYGAIGAALALVSWLIIAAASIVAVARTRCEMAAPPRAVGAGRYR